MSTEVLFSIIFTSLIFITFGLVYLFSNKNKKLSEKHAVWMFYYLKFSLVFVVFWASYFSFSIPYVSDFYNRYSTGEKISYDSEKIKVKEHLIDHQFRIKHLEKELAETKKEVRAFREHYREIIQSLVLCVAILGGFLVFFLKKEDYLKKVLEKKE